jgi:hypothetical protein
MGLTWAVPEALNLPQCGAICAGGQEARTKPSDRLVGTLERWSVLRGSVTNPARGSRVEE